MNQFTAQLLLTTLLLIGAITFALIGDDPLAVALVGAIAGQGASAGVRTAVNGGGRT